MARKNYDYAKSITFSREVSAVITDCNDRPACITGSTKIDFMPNSSPRRPS